MVHALQELPRDNRDFPHDLVFGSVSADDLPTHDFLVAVPLEIKNQDNNYESDYCTSYAATEVAEDQDQVIFTPEWTFAQAKEISAVQNGLSVYSQYGLNLRDICNAAVKKGFIPRINDPFKCDSNTRPIRDILVHAYNWPESLFAIAEKYKKASYFLVTGSHDVFDNIRSALWQNLGERRSVIVGCLWRYSWSNAKNGIIPKTYESGGSGHAFKICGQKTIDGEIYLIAQLSNGVRFGDKGFFYFPRDVVNAEFGPYGQFTFSDVQKEKAEWYITNGVQIYDSVFKKVWKIIANYIGL